MPAGSTCRLGDAAAAPGPSYRQLPVRDMPLLREAGADFFFDWLAHDTFAFNRASTTL